VADPTTTTPYARTRRPMLDAPQRSRGRRSRALLVSLPMFAVFAAFGSIVWLAYVDRPDRPVGEPPLIQADHRPIKLPPDALAGRELAAEGDVGELFTDRPPAQPERILPPPEEPILPGETAEQAPAPADELAVAQAEAPPAETAPPAEAAPPAEDPAPADTPVAEPAPQPAPESEPTVASPEPATPAVDEAAVAEGDAALERLFADLPRPEPTPPAQDGAAAPPAQSPPPAQPTPQPAPEVRPAIAPPAPVQEQVAALPEPGPVLPAPSPGEIPETQPSYRIQLAAVREEADARRAWDLFKVDLGRQLAGVDPIIERAETANGVFYRVQVGSFSDAQSAEALCDSLKRQNASCFVIRR
jgi:hypothetical protein